MTSSRLSIRWRAVAAGLALLTSASVAQADPVDDCITLLNECNAAVSALSDWPRWFELSALGENQKGIDRLDRELKRASEAYDAATTCAKSTAVRSSKRYRPAAERFNKEFPKYYDGLQEARKQYGLIAAAVKLNNELRDMSRALDTATPESHDEWVTKKAAALQKAAEAAKANPYLTAKWQGEWDSALHVRMSNLTKKKAAADQAARRASIVANSVVKTLPEFQRAHAVDPRQVALAFEKMPLTAMVVAEKGASNVSIEYAPVEVVHPKKSRLGMAYPNDKKPETPAFVFYNQNTVFVRYVRDRYKPLAGPTTGLVWDILDDGQVLFVSLDGGRYLARLEHIQPEVGTAASQPTTLTHAVLLEPDVEQLGQQKILKASHAAAMAKAKTAYKACAEKVWKAAKPRFSAIDKANIRPEVRRTRRAELDGKIRRSVDGKCGGQEKRYRSAWNKAMSEYRTLREATLSRARARLSAQK